MASQNPTTQSGRYTASLIGAIRANLEGLQGFDVLALELIQNADDAGASEISFDVADGALVVKNSGSFSYCRSLSSPKCPLVSKNREACDFHRLTEVASGGKLRRSDNIGRFGIGFVSTYQITDCPCIESSGISLTLFPERGQWDLNEIPKTNGTSFTLPWAFDGLSSARRALGTSPINRSHIAQLREDIEAVLRESLLFLRHLKRAELRQNGQLILECDLTRKESEIEVALSPGRKIERWLVLRASAEQSAEILRKQNPILTDYDRKTDVSIALKREPKLSGTGRLYAFLPSDQPSGLPLHINADFFPEPDRKSMIFSGHQHQQLWNELLIQTASERLAKDVEDLRQRLGEISLWELVQSSLVLARSQKEFPGCFALYWEKLKREVSKAAVCKSTQGLLCKPPEAIFADSVLQQKNADLLTTLGAKVVSKDLRPFRNALIETGVQLVTLERLVSLIENAEVLRIAGRTLSSEFDNSLCEVLEDMLRPVTGEPSDPKSIEIVDRLKRAAFIKGPQKDRISLAECSYIEYRTKGDAAIAFPTMSFPPNYIYKFPRLASLITPLSAERAITELQIKRITKSARLDLVRLKPLYSVLAALDRPDLSAAVLKQLADLPIWLSNRELIPATEAFLPGDFVDPTELAPLLDVSALTVESRQFVENRLGVKTLTIDAYVTVFLPRFFTSVAAQQTSKYKSLIRELAKHKGLIDVVDLRKALADLPLIPTMDGKWAKPGDSYFKTESVVSVLGDLAALWVDESRIPNEPSARVFLQALGVRTIPSPAHLVDQMVRIAERGAPTEDAKKASSLAFYKLCEFFELDKKRLDVSLAASRLSKSKCFPALADSKEWFFPSQLHAPYRADGFKSQAKILEFRDFHRLNRAFLEVLGMPIEPVTKLVIDHLRWCVRSKVEPSILTYQILNDRAVNKDLSVEELRNEPSIYVRALKQFVSGERLYWTPQNLGRFVFTVSSEMQPFRELLRAVGAQDSPDARAYIGIILEIVEEYYSNEKDLVGEDRRVYEGCFTHLAALSDSEALDNELIEQLSKSPSAINLKDRLCYPDEVLISDSEWHASLFDGELDNALCKPAGELWPLLSSLGVRHLSASCKVALDYLDGSEHSEEIYAANLSSRMGLIRSLLYDKPNRQVKEVVDAIRQLQVISYDGVKIQAQVELAKRFAKSATKRVSSFYDPSTRKMYVERPVSAKTWSPVFTALFHQLLTSEPASEVSKLALVLSPLMLITAQEGMERLFEAGLPLVEEQQDDQSDLASAEVGFESQEGAPSNAEANESIEIQDDNESDLVTADSRDSSKNDSAIGSHRRPEMSSPLETHHDELRSQGNRSESNHEHRERPAHKEQWDQRLLSYVAMRKSGKSNSEGQGNEHNLAIETASRKAVCEYEILRGRVPEEMAQTHPGFDIVSREPETGDERQIEVKGLMGEWGNTGVSVTRTQFSNAQEIGEDFWLYVVPNALDAAKREVIPIQNPAWRVDAFMFDKNWRDAISKEAKGMRFSFTSGQTVKHSIWGIGQIEKLEFKNGRPVIKVSFKKGGIRFVSVNDERVEPLIQ